MRSFLNNKSAKWNIFSNYGTNVATAAISLLFIPVYIRFLGIEAYGIIGFFLIIQGLLAFLDMGLGVAINRDMARHLGDREQTTYLNNLAYSLQAIYWIIGLFVGIVILCLTPYFSNHWFQESHLPANMLRNAFFIMALTIAVRWPYSIYAAALRGMQLQVLLNVHDMCWNIFKAVGSWLVLLWIDKTLTAFLIFQGACALLQTLTLHFIFWYKLPKPDQPKRFDGSILKGIGRYAAGMGIASIIGSIVYQLDKLIVSKMVIVEQFGYYTLANNISMLVFNVSLPIYMAMFPRFTAMVHKKQDTEVKEQFHFYSRLLAALLIPASALLFFFAKEVLLVWTNNPQLSANTAPLLQVLIIATCLHGLMTMPHVMLLANNKVRFMLYSNIISAVCIVPFLAGFIYLWGVIGAAWAVGVLYAGYFFIQAFVIIRQTLRGEITKWYLADNLPFVLVSIAIFLPATYWLNTSGMNRWELLVLVGILWASCTAVSLFLIKDLRKKIFSRKS